MYMYYKSNWFFFFFFAVAVVNTEHPFEAANKICLLIMLQSSAENFVLRMFKISEYHKKELNKVSKEYNYKRVESI